jgi:hypothetical protein
MAKHEAIARTETRHEATFSHAELLHALHTVYPSIPLDAEIRELDSDMPGSFLEYVHVEWETTDQVKREYPVVGQKTETPTEGRIAQAAEREANE